MKRSSLHAHDAEQRRHPGGQRQVAYVPGEQLQGGAADGQAPSKCNASSTRMKYTTPRTGIPPGFNRNRSIR